MVDKIFDLTKHFVEKGINPWYMMEMLFYFSPAVFVLTVPMAFLVGIVTAFGRLAADNEITAMKSAGIGMHSLIIPVVTISFVLSIFMIFFMDYTLPKGNEAYHRLNMEMRRKNPALVLEPDTIMEEMSRADKKWYFESIDPKTNRMKNIRIWERVSGIPKLIVAEEGELKFYQNWTSLKLYNGRIYQADNKNPIKSYVVGRFAQDEIILDISGTLNKEDDAMLSTSPRNMSMSDIKKELEKLYKQLGLLRLSDESKKAKKYQINDHLVELYKKISIPFACFAFGLIGVPLGLMVRRGGRMIGLGVGVGLITLYYVLLTAGEKLAKIDFLPPFIGAWAPNILTSIAAILLIIRTVRETPLHSSRFIAKLFPSRTGNNSNNVSRR
jgi:LPS export ABC transporter permease LptF